MGDAGRRASRAGEQVRRKARIPALRRRVREVALWGSAGWFTTFGSMGVASELAIDGGLGTLLAVLCAGIALPAVPTGIWAWRGRSLDRAAAREAKAVRLAKRERDELPADVVADWKRLRRAQVLVEDLARQGYVHVDALEELTTMVDELRELLVADRRASDIGAPPAQALRTKVADVADLLVALAAEAVDQRTDEVERAGAPATLRDARDRLAALRFARAEVNAVDDDAARATELVERARAEQAQGTHGTRGMRGPQGTRGPRRAARDEDEGGGNPRATPG